MLQTMDDDDQFSSSEGSTVKGLPCRDGAESLDFDLEESVEPDACFPYGEHLCSLTYNLIQP